MDNPKNFVEFSHFRIQFECESAERIGRGSFGDVYRCKNKLDGKLYAIKRVIFDVPAEAKGKQMMIIGAIIERELKLDVPREVERKVDAPTELERKVDVPTELESKLDEVQIMADLHHQHIVQYYQCWISKIHDEKFVLYIAMELCERTLDDKIRKDGPLEDDCVLRIFKQLMQGLQHIHSRGIIHHDINVVNLFLDAKEDLKIGDFGLAVRRGRFLNLDGLVNEFRAPEMLSGHGESEKADIYAAGLVLLRMVAPADSYANLDFGKFAKALISSTKSHMQIPNCSSKIQELLLNCLQQDPALRMTATAILEELQ